MDTAPGLHDLPEPKWLQEMRNYFDKTGGYRPEDLRRLLGDPIIGVSMPTAPIVS